MSKARAGRRAALGALAVLLSAGALACGDDGQAGGTTATAGTTAATAPAPTVIDTETGPVRTAPAPPLDLAAYRVALADICQRRDAAEQRLEPDDPEDPAELTTFFEGLRDVTLTSRRELQALAPPAELADRHADAVDAFGEAADLLSEGQSLARAGRVAELEGDLFPRLTRALAPIDALATAAGVPECAVA